MEVEFTGHAEFTVTSALNNLQRNLTSEGIL